MLQTLKRVYLYTATTFALLFSAGIIINLLWVLLRWAGLRPLIYQAPGESTLAPPPSSDELLQAVILCAVGLVLVGLAFGGSHYWLIRRDARADPGANGGPTRHLFLNGLLALSTLVTVPFALIVLSAIGDTDQLRNDAFELAFAVTGLVVFVLVLLERQRRAPVGRAATLIRQVQEHALEAVLVVIGSATLVSAFNQQMHWFLIKNSLETTLCYDYTAYPGTVIACPLPTVLGSWLQVLFLGAAWGAYVWMGAWDQRSVVRWLVRYAAFGYGCLWMLIGLQQGVSTVAAVVFSVPDAWQQSLNDGLLFLAFLLTGLLVATLYSVGIHRAPVQSVTGNQARQQGLLAVPAALSFAFVLMGTTLALCWAVEQVIPAGQLANATDWAQAVGFFVAGLGWLPLWLVFQRVSSPAREGPTLPRRGYVLAVLAYTGIAAVAAAAFALYQLLASMLGLTTADHLVARQAAVAAGVICVAAIAHLQRLRVDLRLLHAR